MPQGLEAPQLNAYVNAFSPPPIPKGAVQPMQGMGYPTLAQQQWLYQQQMMAMQQYAYQQQMMAMYGYRPNGPMMAGYIPQQPSSGPMSNVSRYYAGPMPPNPFGPPMMPMPAMPPMPPIQRASFQQPAMPMQQPAMPMQQPAATQSAEQLIRVMRENPYPAQREWAAQSLTSFDWRNNPQIISALVQSATQDPAASVRAGCVYCLGRMGAAVDPVFAALQTMRNDIDPRVRTEVEQTMTRLGQMSPQGR
jgi:hypothetical protein